MNKPVTCDRRDCPALALHHVELYGQDFHFCGHHWAELSADVLVLLCQTAGDAAGASGHGPPPTLAGSTRGR